MDGFSYWTLTDVMFIGIFVWTGLSCSKESLYLVFASAKGMGHEALRRAPLNRRATYSQPRQDRRVLGV